MAAIEPKIEDFNTPIACPNIPFSAWRGRTLRTLDLRPFESGDWPDLAKLLPFIMKGMRDDLNHVYLRDLTFIKYIDSKSILKSVAFINVCFESKRHMNILIDQLISVVELNLAYAKCKDENGLEQPLSGEDISFTFCLQLKRIDITGMQNIYRLNLPDSCQIIRSLETQGPDAGKICRDLSKAFHSLEEAQRQDALQTFGCALTPVAPKGYLNVKVDAALKNLPLNLEQLNLRNCTHISDYKYLCNFADLEELCLDRVCSVDENFLVTYLKESIIWQILSTCTKLKKLDLSGQFITYFILKVIEELPNITYLKIARCHKISDEEIQELQRARPDLTILADDTDQAEYYV